MKSTWMLAAVLLSGCGGATGDAGAGAETELARQPNLILLLTDDQRYDTLSCNGATVLETPHLDGLAGDGALMRRAYVTTSLCCPARASVYTGQYLTGTGIKINDEGGNFLERMPDFPELLQGAGYATAFFGKWHIPNPNAGPQPGFDRWVSFEGQGQYEDENFNVDGERRVIKGYNTDVLFDMAMEWIGERGDEPYCLVLSLKNLHRPPIQPARHFGALQDVAFAPARSASQPLEELPLTLQKASQGRRNGSLGELGAWEEHVRGYHELVLSVDDNVGRLVDCLKSRGDFDQSAFCMTSDGGFLWGEHRLWRKRTAYEPSIHVPMIWHWPGGIPAGSEPAGLALNVDVAPTFLDLAGLPIPAEMHGRSLRPLWEEDGSAWREGFSYVDGWGQTIDGPIEIAWVDARYKYVRYRRGSLEERLFDLLEDPEELVDLAQRPEHAQRVEAMRSALRKDLVRIGGDQAWVDQLAVSLQ